MAYTEIKKRNEKKYYYRVKSVREKDKISKKRIYLGLNLEKESLQQKEKGADKIFLKEKIDKSISKIKPIITKIMKKNGIKKAGIFGSYARGEQTKASDIDILIEPPKEMGFFEIVRLEENLNKELNKKIDLLTYSSIHKLLRKRILNDEIRII